MATRKKRPAAKKKRPAAKKKTAAKKRVGAKKKRPAAKKKRSGAKKKQSGAKRRPATKKRPAKKPATKPRRPRPAPGPGPAPVPPPTTPPSPTPTVPASPPPPRTQGAIGGPAGIRVRMYRVGFGDFFLLSLRGSDGTPQHILIDCGVHAANLGSIGQAIKQLAQDTDKQLALVIMTHHHADHISGFAIGKDDFKEFNVGRVWMPWFEDPTNKTAVSVQTNLTAAATQLQLKLAARGTNDQFRSMAENITGTLSAAGGSNAVALETLKGGFKNPAPVDYYKAGDPAQLPDALVRIGLTAKIVGPPGPDQLDLVAQMDNNKYQYLAGDTDDSAPPTRINPVFKATKDDYPAEAFELFSAAKIAQQVAAAQPDVLAAQAQKADNTVNNQSLVVFFAFGGKTMLFAGDAQWGNWDNFLFDGAVVGDTTPLTSSSKSMLSNLDFYKVGHHGSRNATPIPAVTNMRDGVVAMCSTQPGAYGSAPDPAKGKGDTRVPQQPLLDALNAKTKQRLARSDQVGVPGITLDQSNPQQATDTKDPLPAMFTKNDKLGYIDYEM